MNHATATAHLASIAVNVPAEHALARLSDPEQVGRWALGSMGLVPAGEPGVFRGTSLFDGSDTFVEIEAHSSLGLVDYHVGTEDERSPRVSIRIADGPLAGLGPESCVIALSAWRQAAANDERWARTCTTHETEVLLIKAQLETGYTERRRA